MDLVHQPRFKKRGVGFAAAFAEQPFDAPFFPEPAKREAKVNFPFAADFDVVGERPELFQFREWSAFGCKNDDRREAVFEDFRLRVNRASAADDDAQVVFGLPAPDSLLTVFPATRPECHRREIQRPRSGHDGIGGGAEFEQMLLVGFAAKGDEMAAGRGKLAVGGGRGVQKNERQGRRRTGRAHKFRFYRILCSGRLQNFLHCSKELAVNNKKRNCRKQRRIDSE